MKTPKMSLSVFLLILFLSSIIFAGDPLFKVKQDLFNQLKSDNLGLTFAEGTETITIFEAVDSTDKYCNGAVMIGFNGYLYCQWQSSEKDEDSEDTWVAYSRSKDGIKWLEPMVLNTSIVSGHCTSGGWLINKDTIVAYINVWSDSVTPRGGFTYYKTSSDGINWSDLKPLLMNDGKQLEGVIEQDPRRLENGRIVGAAHFQPGLIVSPIHTDDPSGIRGWQRAEFENMSIKKDVSRGIEPSLFVRNDNSVVMVFRDQLSSYKKLASISYNNGKNWTTPVITNMPDSRSKQSAGNLPNRTAYLVGNPVNNKTRFPLVITLSQEGKFFNKAYLLRSGGDNLPEQKFEGKYKREGYHYPKSMVWGEYLYVSYTTNKEIVEFTRVPLDALIAE